MKENSESKNQKYVRGGVEWYREKIIDIAKEINDETMLKKIYTFSKTLKNILNEKEGG